MISTKLCRKIIHRCNTLRRSNELWRLEDEGLKISEDSFEVECDNSTFIANVLYLRSVKNPCGIVLDTGEKTKYYILDLLKLNTKEDFDMALKTYGRTFSDYIFMLLPANYNRKE